MALKSRKNISSNLADIKPPKKNIAKILSSGPQPVVRQVSSAHEETPRPDPAIFEHPYFTSARTLSSKTIALLSVFFMLIAGGIIISGFLLQKKSIPLLSFISYHGSASAGSDSESFRQSGWFDRISNLVKKGTQAYRDGAGFALAVIQIKDKGLDLVNQLPDYLVNRRGQELIAHLKSINELIKKATQTSGNISQTYQGSMTDVLSSAVQESGGDKIPGEETYLSIRFTLERAGVFLDELIRYLEEDHDHHLLVLFENPAELRPGGGFLGSYADLTIRRGAIVNAQVHDINYADRGLETATVPPQPLQSLVANWRAADANWFFSFPDSAERVIHFMEQSKVYRSDSISFDGAIAVSGRAIEGLLDIVGSIQVVDSAGNRLEIRSDNLLSKIQDDVQLRQKKNEGDAKTIIAQIASAIIQKNETANSDTKQGLARFIYEQARAKNIMVYMKNRTFQDFFDSAAVSGALFKIPDNFNGVYLGFAAANIGGQKSDLFIKNSQTLQVRVGSDGFAYNRLMVARDYAAPSDAPWWYTADNASYFQIFTDRQATPTNSSGVWNRTVSAKADYKTESFSRDPLVEKVESTIQAYPDLPGVIGYQYEGKNVFGFWTKLSAGQKKEYSLDYTTALINKPADGVSYQFVLEKQSGMELSQKLEINAPLGYIWKQNSRPVYEYETSNPPGRLTLELTLQKQE